MTKIRSSQFGNLADWLAQTLKSQIYLDGKLHVYSYVERIQEITDIITCVEAFTVYSWISPGITFPAGKSWHNVKTSHQFRGKAWLHLSQHLSQRCSSSSTFNRLVPHESVSLQFSNLHVSTPPKLLIIGLVASISSKFCGSWNNGTHHWSFGQCHFCHWCAKCEGQPHVNCPFKASKFYPQHQWWNSRRTFLRTVITWRFIVSLPG